MGDDTAGQLIVGVQIGLRAYWYGNLSLSVSFSLIKFLAYSFFSSPVIFPSSPGILTPSTHVPFSEEDEEEEEEETPFPPPKIVLQSSGTASISFQYKKRTTARKSQTVVTPAMSRGWGRAIGGSTSTSTTGRG